MRKRSSEINVLAHRQLSFLKSFQPTTSFPTFCRTEMTLTMITESGEQPASRKVAELVRREVLAMERRASELGKKAQLVSLYVYEQQPSGELCVSGYVPTGREIPETFKAVVSLVKSWTLHKLTAV